MPIAKLLYPFNVILSYLSVGVAGLINGSAVVELIIILPDDAGVSIEN